MSRTRARRAMAPRLEVLEGREVPAVVGGLDPSFDTDGKLSVGGVSFTAVAVQTQAGNKTVAVASSGGNFLIERFNPDGSVDTTFGAAGTGKVSVDIDGAGKLDAPNAVAIDAQGRIVVAGTGGIGLADFSLVRLAADGKTVEINTSYSVGTSVSSARAIAFQTDGTIVLAGTAKDPGGSMDDDMTVIRVDAASGLQIGPATFIPHTGDDVGNGVAVYPAGANSNKIVVVGTTGPVNDWFVARLNADNSLDGTFNGGSSTKIFDLSGGTADAARGVAIDGSGNIVAVGTSTGGGGTHDFTIIRVLSSNATLDPTFALGAPARIDFGGDDDARAVLIQPDGKIVVAGDTSVDMAVVRLNPTGFVDLSFNGTGKQTIDFGAGDIGVGVATTFAGRIVVAGGGGGKGDIARLIGAVEKGDAVAAGGVTNGTAVVFDPASDGILPGVPTASVSVFGAIGANARTAVGDVNGDGVDDTILATGPGAQLRVAVVSGVDNATPLVLPFAPFAGSEDFAGGGFVAAGDFDGDGRAEFVVTPDVTGGPRVTVFDIDPSKLAAAVVRSNFFGIDDPDFRGGARPAVGDVDGDGTPDLIVAAGFGGGPRVAVFNGRTVFAATPTRLVGDFFGFPGTDAVNLRNGAYVASGDVNGDGFADLVLGGGPGGSPRIFILSGAAIAAGDLNGAYGTPISSFFVAGNSADRGGVRVSVSDLDGDHKADVVAGSGEGNAAGMRVYLGRTVLTAAEPVTPQDVALFGGVALPGGVFVG